MRDEEEVKGASFGFKSIIGLGFGSTDIAWDQSIKFVGPCQLHVAGSRLRSSTGPG
jgi:hypothetical protein